MKKLFLLLISLAVPFLAFAQIEGGAENLLFATMELPVATITKTTQAKIPASVTVITKDDIEIAAARNIYDLIEIYVPGAFWMVHNEDPHVGIRGINADRSYKLLVLLNGRKLNQDMASGALAELEMWDLNDIERIEVIRGPGSVTYGPGAIEGVINITTKNAKTSSGTEAGVQYVNTYQSTGVHLSHGLTKENFSFYIYGSITKTRGFMPPTFQLDTTNRIGYVGQDSFKGLEPLDYFRDYNDIPQRKIYAELNFLEDWKLWAQFTNWGATRYGNGATGGSKYPNGTADVLNSRQNRDRLIVVSLENKHDFSDKFNLATSLGWSSTDHRKRSSGSGLADADTLSNYVYNFSETEFNFKTIGQYTLADKYKFATGLEWARKYIGPGWDDSIYDFRAESAIFGSPEGRTAFGNTATTFYIVGEGWNTDRISWLGEANLEFHKLFNLILSGRTDHHTYTDTSFSPRIAAISDFDNAGMLKVIWQKSVRINTEGYLLQDALTGAKSRPETLKGWEVIYDVKPTSKLTLTGSVFTNVLEAIGYSTSLLTTNVVGTLKYYGFDLEAKYKTDRYTAAVSQSLTKQRDFELGPGQTTNGLSYKDYGYTTGGASYLGEGNDLNNWSNWATKFYFDVKATPKITVHTDARILWGFEGMQAGLDMIEQGTTLSDDNIRSVYMDYLDGRNAFKMDFRLNLAIKYEPTKNLSTVVFVQNLFGANGNKRYAYDAGLASTVPNRAFWVEEPRVWGVKVNYKF